MILSSATSGCSSWSDLTAKWARYSEKEKGDLFEELTKAYLILEPKYACKLKHVWLGREIPQAVAKKLKLPSTDYGIDIVAETLSGEFWAVQCKYRQDSNQSLTFGALSTFQALAFGVCQGFSYGLVCSTTERFSHVLKGQDLIGFCSLDDWQSLDADFFKRLRAHLAQKPTTLKPLKPRPHQKTAIADGVEHFIQAKASRGKLIMPCGSGKSLTAYFLAQEIGAKRILIAVPSLSLIRQTLKVWLRETLANRQDVDWICVCSDESAGRVDRDDVAVLRQDLGVPCLTDSEKISAWLKKKPKGLRVVFTTYQSGEALSEAVRSAGVRFDLGIMDEAHKTVGDGKSLFSHLLHDGNLPIRRRLFMTATERRYSGKSDEVVSMDDPAIYGDTFHLLSFKRAMEFDPPILSDYKIISICVSREEVAKLIRKNVFLKPDKGPWSKDIEADMLASLIALRKAMSKHPIRHAVSFHSSIQRAEVFKIHNDAFTQIAPEFGDLATYHVSGATPTGTRSRIISDFARSERALITNARCLTEGVDVPGIDCVLFADPRRSAVDIVQGVGRALRPSQGKECGYVIVPILHDENATPEDIFDSESFKEILSTLRSLAANDERIIEYFRAVSEGRKTTSRGVSFDIDERIAKNIDLAEFVREIELRCWDLLAKLSWRSFEEARAFVYSLNLKSNREWRQFCKGKKPEKGMLPADIPTNPNQTYATEGWKGFGDWLGTGTIAPRLREYLPFKKARAFVRSLELRSGAEWDEFCKGQMPEKGFLPADIPIAPRSLYCDSGWLGLGDWLGTNQIATHLREYRPFKEARAFVHSLKLKNQHDWRKFTKGELPQRGRLPFDIPAAPDRIYVVEGWKGFGDWLGTGTIASRFREYRPFEEARAFVHSLKLKNQKEWVQFCKGMLPEKGMLPTNIPITPYTIYEKEGWKGLGDWLGTGTIATFRRGYRPFEEARAFVHSLKLKNQAEWRKFSKGQLPEKGMLPVDIPGNPHNTYAKEGWKGHGDWLGTGAIATREMVYRPFCEARAFVHSLNIKSASEWRLLCKGQMPELGTLPSDIPAAPNQTYAKSGWVGMGDWLGTRTIATFRRVYRPFEEARAFVHSLRLRSSDEWHKFCKGKMPDDIPTNPNRTYAKKGWKGFGNWLGTGTIAPRLREYLPFEEARAFVHSLNLKNSNEWRQFCNGELSQKGMLPIDIPAAPNNTYAAEGWKGFGNWLGTGTIASRHREYLSFEEARAFVQSLNLKNQDEWRKFCKDQLPEKGFLPVDIPSNPNNTYATKGWKGYGNWLGTGTIAPRLREYLPFEEARAFAHSLNLNSASEWRLFCKGQMSQKGTLLPNIPANPNQTYAKSGWVGMSDWLGTGRKPRKDSLK